MKDVQAQSTKSFFFFPGVRFRLYCSTEYRQPLNKLRAKYLDSRLHGNTK
jgi:hypothetical protein